MTKGLPDNLVIARKVPWREEGDRVMLLAPRFGTGFFGRLIHRFFPYLTLRLKLDDLGTCVWKRCDGGTALAEIVNSLEDTFGDKAEQAEERVEMFLRELHRNKWIEFLEPQAEKQVS